MRERRGHDGWCKIAATVRPFSATRPSVATTSRAVRESRPQVASSTSRICGRPASSTPMLSRRRSPNETPRTPANAAPCPTRECLMCKSPSTCSSRFTSRVRSRVVTFADRRTAAAKARVSSTEKSGRSAPSSVTKPSRDLCSLRFVGCPSSKTVPSDAANRPERTVKKDVLPAPDGPSTAVTRPRRNSPETLLRQPERRRSVNLSAMRAYRTRTTHQGHDSNSFGGEAFAF